MNHEELAKRLAKYDSGQSPSWTARNAAGRLTVDDVIDVLTQEQTEDVQDSPASSPSRRLFPDHLLDVHP